MRIKIIGDNDCARATRHLLRLAGFAVTEFLPAEAIAGGPVSGYAITIELAPAIFSPDARLRPDPATHRSHTSGHEEAGPVVRDASSPSFARDEGPRTTEGEPSLVRDKDSRTKIHFDSADSALEAAVLRHVAQLAAAPVVVDRPGGAVHSDRELRIVLPNCGDAAADEAAAVAVELGVLRGLLDLSSAGTEGGAAGTGGLGAKKSPGNRWLWPFGIVLMVAGLGIGGAGIAGRPGDLVKKGHRLKPAPLAAGFAEFSEPHRLKSVLLESAAQGQFDTGQGLKITDGNDFLVVDPCKGQTKSFVSISQTANAQLVAGTASKKIYICSIHVVAAAAANVAVVEGTGSVCGTGTSGVSGFGGATAATGWNFAANGGIALGNGDSSLGAEGASGDNLCAFSSGSGQISGGISYVVQ